MTESPHPPPAFLPQGPAPAHVLTITITADRMDADYELDARCGCPFPTGRQYRMTDGTTVPITGWSSVYGAEDPADAMGELLYDWEQHRESCARRFGVAALR